MRRPNRRSWHRPARSPCRSRHRPTAAAPSPATPRPARRATVAPPATDAGGVSPIVVTGLTNGKTYTCTVIATNADGNSAASAASASAVPGLVPDAPAQPTVTHGNAPDLGRVHAHRPATAAARSPATPRPARRATAARPVRTPAPSSPIVASALTNGKTYTCTVFATNVNGPGPRVGRFGVDHSRDDARRARPADADRTATRRSR